MKKNIKFCHFCYEEASLGARFCGACGTPLAVVQEYANHTPPICPYCNAALKSFPKSKKVCPSCNNTILVRSIPFDPVKRLVTEAEAEEIANMSAIVREVKTLDRPSREVFEKRKAILSDRYERILPSLVLQTLRHAKWEMYNRYLLEYEKGFQWGLYRNVRRAMAEQLNDENKLIAALKTNFEVCYLDLNGANNVIPDPELLKQFPPFDPKQAFLAPAVVQRINSIIKKLALTKEQAQEEFFTHNEIICKNLGLPVTVEDAWSELEPDLVVEQ